MLVSTKFKRDFGVKAEEVEWSGVKEFLEGKKKVTKQELLAYLAENQIEIQEITKGGAPEVAEDLEYSNDGYGEERWTHSTWDDDTFIVKESPDSDYVAVLDNNEEEFVSLDQAAEFIQQTATSNGGTLTKFSDYQLPGGENYREVLLKLRGVLPAQQYKDFKRRMSQKYGLNYPEVWHTMSPAEQAEDTRLGEQEIDKSWDQYDSTHWPQDPNTLVHIRVSDRTVDGKKVLHVEEIQSDWHQEARKTRNKEVKRIAKPMGYKKEGNSKKENQKILDKAAAKVPADFGYGSEIITELPDGIHAYSKNMAINAKTIRNNFKKHYDTVIDGLSEVYDGLSKTEQKQIEKLDDAVQDYLDKEPNAENVGDPMPFVDWANKVKPGTFSDEFTNPVRRAKKWFVKGSGKYARGNSNLLDSADEVIIGRGRSKNEAVKDALSNINKYNANQSVPNAPFKGTDKWTMLAMRRLVRMAAEGGYDSIAWTQGQEQADRYSLSKQVDTISYRKHNDGTYTLMVVPIGSNTALDNINGTSMKRLEADSLEGIIGKEVTQKIIDGESDSIKHDGNFNELKTLENESLKVGGEGMKQFYDVMLKKNVNDFFNKGKWGKARVGEIEIGDALIKYKVDMNENEDFIIMKKEEGSSWTDAGVGTFDLLDEADSTARKMQGEAHTKLHNLPITDKMRDKALTEGMPLFSKADPTDSRAFKKWFGKSKVVDSAGKPLVVYHGSDDANNITSFESGTGLIWFTDNKFEAELYGHPSYPDTMSMYLSIQKPAGHSDVVKAAREEGISEEEIEDEYGAKILEFSPDILENLKHKGFDGAILDDIGEGADFTSYIAFNPTQIKSATGNDGTYGVNNPDIRFSKPDPADVKAGQKELRRIMKTLQQYTLKDEFKVSQTKTRNLVRNYLNLRKKLTNNQVSVEDKVKEFKKLLMQMPIHVRGKALAGFPRIVTAKRPETKEKYFQAAKKRAEKEVNNYFRKETLAKIQKLRRKKVKVKGHKQSNIGHEATATLEHINNLFNGKDTKTELQQAQKIAALGVKLAELESKPASPANTRDIKKLKDQIAVTEIFGGYMDASLADLEYARDTLDKMLKDGRVMWKLSEEGRKAATAEMVGVASQDVTGKEVPTHETRAQMTRRQLKQSKSALYKIRKTISNGDTLHSSWHFLMDKLSRKGKGKTLRTRMVERLGGLVAWASNKQNELNQVAINMMQDKLHQLTGKKGWALQRWVNRMSNDTIEFDINSTDEVTGAITPEKIPLSQMQAAYWWAIGRRGDAFEADGNSSVSERLELMGVDKAFMKQIESKLDQEVLDFAVWLSETMGEHIWAMTNPIHEARYGSSITRSADYTPIRADYNQGREASDLFQKSARGSTLVKGALKELTNTKMGVKDANLLDVWVNHIHDMNHFAAWAMPLQHIEGVFANQSLRRHIERVHGQAMNGYIQDWIEIFKGNSAQQRDHLGEFGKWRGRFATAVLGLNPAIYIKQLTSIPAMAADIPTASWTAGMASFMANPVKAIRILRQSQFIKTRYKKGHTRDVSAANLQSIGQMMGGTTSLPSKLMGLVKLGDMQAIYLGGWSVYRHYNKKYLKQGMGKNAAHKKALERFEQTALQTQQTGEKYGMSLIQQGGGLQQLFTMFMSAPILYYMQVSSAVRNMKKAPVDSAKRLFLFWVVVPALFEAIANAPLALDEDEEDREVFLKRVTRGVVLGPINGLFIARDASKYLVNMMFMREEVWQGASYSSMTKPIDDAGVILKNFVDLANGDEANIPKTVEALIDLLGIATGLPAPALQNYIQGIQQVIDDDTEHPVAKVLGYTNWSTGDRK